MIQYNYVNNEILFETIIAIIIIITIIVAVNSHNAYVDFYLRIRLIISRVSVFIINLLINLHY